MSLRNYFYRFGKYILTFFFVTLLMVLFGPLQAQAAITKEVTTDGFKLSGTGSMNVWDGDVSPSRPRKPRVNCVKIAMCMPDMAKMCEAPAFL